MSAPGRAKLRPAGVLRAAGRLVLLVALGFGAGVLIGVIFEEPELLVGHLRGEGESVSLAIVQPESETDEGDAQSADPGRPLEEVDSQLRIQSAQARRLGLQRETGESRAAILSRVAAAVQPGMVVVVDRALGPVE